jgi:maltose alpha-D-glucosyltransferase / alpha-amylase
VEGLWHKNAIVYTIDLESFADGNGDGIGDFSVSPASWIIWRD